MPASSAAATALLRRSRGAAGIGAFT